jgi:hypothetical protein
MQLIEPRAPLDSLDLAERAANGSTGPNLRSLFWALVVLGVMLGCAAWWPPDFDESLALRWLRVASDHPIRTGLALWLLVRALLPGSATWTEGASRDGGRDGTSSLGIGRSRDRADTPIARDQHDFGRLPSSPPAASGPGKLGSGGGKLVVNPYDA